VSEDYAVWDIDQILEAYVDEPEFSASVEVGFTALFVFLQEHGLLTCRVTDASGTLVKRTIMASEITGEGKRLACGPKNPVQRWLGSKAGQKNPPDMRPLEKALVLIRTAG
jgi:hypothetical protein